jgi:hypothetical protein
MAMKKDLYITLREYRDRHKEKKLTEVFSREEYIQYFTENVMSWTKNFNMDTLIKEAEGFWTQMIKDDEFLNTLAP